MSKGIRTDKLDTGAALLEDSIAGFFSGNSIQTTTHLSFAVMTLVRDLSNYYKSNTKADLNFTAFSDRVDDQSVIKMLFRKNKDQIAGYNHSLIDRANFVKHAKEDPLGDDVLLGKEDVISLSLAIEDFGNFFLALKEKGLCCSVAEYRKLPIVQLPKFMRLAQIFYRYQEEHAELSAPFEKQRNYDSALIVIDELKRKYWGVIQQSDLAKGRSESDRLILLDSCGPEIKTTAPGLSPRR